MITNRPEQNVKRVAAHQISKSFLFHDNLVLLSGHLFLLLPSYGCDVVDCDTQSLGYD